MGKVKKNKGKNGHRHDPLDQQILEHRYARPSSRNKVRSKHPKDEEFVNTKSTSEILTLARQQQEDLEEVVGSSLSNLTPQSSLGPNDGFEEEEEVRRDDNSNEFISINEDDEKAIESFMSKDSQKRATLADIIKERLTEKETEILTMVSDAGTSTFETSDEEKSKLKPYIRLRPILRSYRSGRLPVIFKLIHRCMNWEKILYLTEPDKWSAAAMFQATRIFCSNLEDKKAQKFYSQILLPRLRDDIAECKKLNDHLYHALEKALYKPAAFFKGIVIPLCESGNCTYREATIIGSVLAKHSVPVLHSGATLLTIAQMDYFGVASIFMRILLEKKYALPYRVLNAVVDHFLRFMDDTRKLPLLWHQCLLTFVQLYKGNLSSEQIDGLLKLTAVQKHEHVTPEIRKLLRQKPSVKEVTEQFYKL